MSTITPQPAQVARLRGPQRRSSASPSTPASFTNYPSNSKSSFVGANTDPPRRDTASDPFISTPRMTLNAANRAQSTPQTRRGGVRIAERPRKPLLQRLWDIPTELYDRYEMRLSETINIDIDEFKHFGYPAGVAALTLHVLLRLAVSASDAFVRDDPRESRSYSKTAQQRLQELQRATSHGFANAAAQRSFLYGTARTLSWLLVLASIINASYLFSSRRKYRMFMRLDPLSSPNARTVAVNARLPVDEDGHRTSIWRRLVSRAKQFIVQSKQEPSGTQVQELSIWTPAPLLLHFFAIYSPPLAILLQFLHRNNIGTFGVAGALLLVQTYGLVRIYSQTLKDRLTLSGEVLREYDAKFVNPRVNYARSDASTSTDDLMVQAMHSPWSARRGYAYDGQTSHYNATPTRASSTTSAVTRLPRSSTGSNLSGRW